MPQNYYDCLIAGNVKSVLSTSGSNYCEAVNEDGLTRDLLRSMLTA